VKALNRQAEVTIIAINDVSDSTRIKDLSEHSSDLRLVKSKLALVSGIFFLALRKDVIFSYSVFAGVFGGIVGWIYGIKRRVVLFSGLGYLNYIRKKTFLSRIITMCLRFKNSAIFVNNEDANKLEHSYNLGFQNKLIILGEGMDLQTTASKTPVNKVCVYAGRLHPQKCVDALVDAFSAQSNLSRLILVGFTEQDLKDYYNRDFNLENIECVGRVNDIAPYLDASRYAIMPSIPGEGFPTFLMEAMVNSRICISTNTFGNLDAMDKGRNGYLINHDYFRNLSSDYAGAVQQFKRTMSDVGNDLVHEEELVKNAMTFMESNCERKEVAKKIANFIIN
jgi:glycosyltransferase involved in cell wall biosynthesis